MIILRVAINPQLSVVLGYVCLPTCDIEGSYDNLHSWSKKSYMSKPFQKHLYY